MNYESGQVIAIKQREEVQAALLGGLGEAEKYQPAYTYTSRMRQEPVKLKLLISRGFRAIGHWTENIAHTETPFSLPHHL